MSKRLIAALFGVLALALVGAGCGSSSGDSSSSGGTGSSESSSALTKAEFIKAADAVCKKGNETITTEAEEFAEENEIDTEKATTKEQEEVVSEVVAPAILAQAEGISELSTPSGEEEAVEEIVEAVESGAEEAEEDPGALVLGQGRWPVSRKRTNSPTNSD